MQRRHPPKPGGKEKQRPGAPLGAALQRYFDNPPYKSKYLVNSYVWTPKLFAAAVGVSDSAVRQWLRGDELPTQNMSSITRALFSEKSDGFENEIKELWGLLKSCERVRDAKNDAPSRTGHIPETTRHFIGRNDDVEKLSDMLGASNDGCAILIQGGPGMGKTELTKAIAHHPRIIERFSERRFFVRLEITSTAATMQDAILRAAGCDGKLDLQSAFRSEDGKPTLLILDNLEKPWESVEGRNETETMLKELSEIPGLSVLASFRGIDFVDGPAWYVVRVDAFSSDTSKKLFAKIAGQWATTDSHFENFIAALGGIPLAINLVARRAHNRTSLKPLWHQWKQIGADFAKHPDFPENATTSLPYSIELSLKSPRLRAESDGLRLFAFLGCLPAGLSDLDCQSLLGKAAFRAEESLLNTGLAVFEMNRIDLLPPIREHAKRYYALNDNDNRLWVELFLQKTLTFYKSIDKLEGSSAALDIFFDVANINEAMIEIISNEIGISIFQYIEPYFIMASCVGCRNDNVTIQLKRKKDILSEEQSTYLDFMNASMLFGQGELIEAYEITEKSYLTFNETDNKVGMAYCLWLGATVMYSLDKNAIAVDGFEEALEISKESSDKILQNNIEITLISALSHLDRFDEARKFIEKYSKFTNKNENFYDLYRNMQYYSACGDFQVCQKNDLAALEFYLKALNLANYTGNIKFEQDLLGVVCEFYEKSGQIESLSMYAERLIKLYNSLGDLYQVPLRLTH
jgi:tetratricopeptide (TPR) repeat protein